MPWECWGWLCSSRAQLLICGRVARHLASNGGAARRAPSCGEGGMKHPYHLVDPRPWPVYLSVGILFFFAGFTGFFHNYDAFLSLLGLLLVSLSLIRWFRDVWREGTMQGKHTQKVVIGLRMGIFLFIVRECLFFFSFFWAFFHSSLNPSFSIHAWPPVGLEGVNPFNVPLLNTILLLSRGASLTWTHISLINSLWLESVCGFVMTLNLALLFTLVQCYEYRWCSFGMSDSVYGRVFFVATGFHGLHVILGTVFISLILMRLLMNHFSSLHHVGFEARAWYWHFVDVVWLFLYVCVYWWGF